MTTTKRALAWVAGGLLAASLAGCGGNDQAAEMTQDTAAGDPAAQPAGAGTAAGAMAIQAMTSYLQEGGADATGRAFALDQVTFEPTSSTLDAADKQALSEVAAVLKQHPGAAVTITSHVAADGDAAANKKLAAARAVSVKNAIAEAGASNKLMTNVVEASANGAVAPERQVELLVKRG